MAVPWHIFCEWDITFSDILSLVLAYRLQDESIVKKQGLLLESVMKHSLSF